MMQLIATLAQVGPAIEKAQGEGSWITTGLVTALLGGIALIIGAYFRGAKSKGGNDFVSAEEFERLEADVKEGFEKLTEAMGDERAVARKANGTIHQRIDVTQSMVHEIKGQLGGVAANVSKLLDLALEEKNKPK